MHYVYLCSNLDFLKLMLEKLPRELDINLHVIVNDRRSDLIQDIKSMCKQRSDIEFDVRTDGDIIKKVKREADIVNPLSDTYKLFVKMCLPILSSEYDEQILFTDDDVMVLNDPSRFMEHDWFGTYAGMDRLGYNEPAWRLCDFLSDAIGTFVEPMSYNEVAVDAGIWSWRPNLVDPWLKVMNAFWSGDGPKTLYRPELKLNNAFRLMDQRLMTAFGHLHKPHILKSVHERRILCLAFDNAMSKGYIRWPYPTTPTFIHYGASSHKPTYVDWYRKHIPDVQEIHLRKSSCE